MKRIIASTALALMMSTAAMADGHGVMKTYTMERSGDFYASEFIGKRVYAAEKDYDTFTAETRLADGAEREWDDIGEVNDVILGRDGQVKAVILGVGGFIGIGEKDVAIPMDQLKMVQEEGEEPGDTFLVVNANKETLTAAEGFKRAEVVKTVAQVEATTEDAEAKVEETTTMAAAEVEEINEDAEAKADKMESRMVKIETVEPTDGEVKLAEGAENTAESTVVATETDAEVKVEETAETTTATETEVVKVEEVEPKTDETVVAETTTEPKMDGERMVLRAPTIEREGYATAELESLTTEDLTGARIYGAKDEDIGEIDRLLVSTDGKIERAVLDIGGFLGLGEHSIAVTMDELRILREDNGTAVRVYIDATQEQLEAQPEFEG